MNTTATTVNPTTVTIGKSEFFLPLTDDMLETVTKPALLAHCELIGLSVPKGPISKTDLIDMLLDHYEYADTVGVSQPTVSPVTSDPQPVVSPVTSDPEPSTVTDSTPSPDNAPTGMVYCRECQQHVPKSKTVPTSELGVYICLMGCKKAKASKPNSTTAKAKAAHDGAKAANTPNPKKETTPRKTLFPDHATITAIQLNPKKAGSASHEAYNSYREGMTVSEYIKAVGPRGRLDLKWDSERGFITISF